MQPFKTTCAIFLIGMFLTSIAGFVVLADYSTRPGQHPPVLKALPVDFNSAAGSSTDNAPTIILFYHPKCPCTLATARSLQRLKTTLPKETAILAFAYLPGNEPERWIQSGTTEILQRMPGVEVRIDKAATACRSFGVAVSGHVLVYNRQYELTFSGGLTPSRGHEGDCLASSQFLKCARGDDVECSHWPVFGCVIQNSGGEPK